MPDSTDLGLITQVVDINDLLDDVGWLDRELIDASAGRESDLMRLLLSRVTFNNMFQFCALLDPQGTIWDVNAAALSGAGLSRRDIHGQPFWQARWWQTSARTPGQLKKAIKRAAAGAFVRYDVDVIGRAGGTELITLDFSIQPVTNRNGTVRFLICEGRDVTEQRRLEREVARQREELTQLNKVGIAVSSELDLERAVQVVTDAATELTGASFGSFFYNVVNERGEAYTLYTLSGAPREAFSKFPMPRNTEVFGPTFRGEGIVRSPDITKDPRFGKNDPYFGMPEGHLPVCSYLAAPVVSQAGEVLGGLFLGHPDPDVFTEHAERILETIAVQAAIAIDKARLYRAAKDEIEQRKRIETALLESEARLEKQVLERTTELAASNERLIEEAKARETVEGRFRLMVEGVIDYALFMLDPKGMVANWNTGAQRIKGYSAEEIIGRHFSTFYTDEDRAASLPATALATATAEGKFENEGWRVRKDGTRFFASVVINAIRDKRGKLVGFAKITRDISERRDAAIALQRSQEQLAQAQKMEGIGHLTGGVAHDFNNLLTIIIGNLESLQRALQRPQTDLNRLRRSTENAMRGAQRAAALTQRLLAFARRQPLDPKSVDVSRLVAAMSDLLRRTIGEQVQIETVLAGGLWRAHVDPNQLETSILNLAVNARDAMPQGGKLTIETANAYLDEVYAAAQVEVAPGQYVVVSITDNGSGMTPEVLDHAFEPFFTTKDSGQGTGLGLSQVYGFVKQSGGHVKIYTEPGQGTSVKIYLPRWHADEETQSAEAGLRVPRTGASELILVVEDDEDVRAHSREVLQELGYRTLDASTGRAALDMLAAHSDIQILFTDVGLPGGMNGRQLADEARRRRPDLKVLFTTGYARNAIVHDGRLDPGVQVIPKPFTSSALAAKLTDMLDAQAGPRRILLVEDEPLIQMLAIEHLEALGFKVETAGSSTEAMSKLRLMNGEVEAAIVDLGLPDRKGDVLVSELRALYARLPIVIASGHADEGLRDRFQGDALVAFLEKPYTAAQLRAALDSLKTANSA